MTRKFAVSYEIRNHPDGIRPAALSGDMGAADALIVVSIVEPPSGGKSYVVISTDGQKQLSPDEIFKAWAVMASQLAETLPPGGRRGLAQAVFDSVQEAVTLVRFGKPDRVN